MDDKKITGILLLITPEIIERLVNERGLNYEKASETLYGSELYAALENIDTGLWRLSPLALYSLLDEELATGKITFPEEQ